MTTREMRKEMMTENNKLGLQAYDLVQTTGKGIGIVLPKKSLDGELVIYSMSSASITHPGDDDGMAKVRRYNEDGTIATHSEKTGRRLKNRDIYTITGVVSYDNPILAMKDFINQNPDLEFDPVVDPEPEVPEVDETMEVDTEEAKESEETTSADTKAMMTMFEKMTSMFGNMADKLDAVLNRLG